MPTKSMPLYKQIIHDILEQIHNGELRPGDRILSENELSGKYMVSSITSKNALAELADKGYITRIKGKGSFVNSIENLASIPSYSNTMNHRTIMHSKTIGLVIPSMKTGIDQQLLNAVEMELSKTEYILAIIITRENQLLESGAIKKLRDRGASGLIIFPTEHEMYNEEILKLNLDGFPFVLVDRYLKGIRASCVYTDNYGITRNAVTHMLKNGCHNPAFISPNSRNTVTEDRLNGFKDTLFEQDIAFSTQSMCKINLSITEPEEKKDIIRHYLKENPEIDGLFCANKEMAKYICSILTSDKLWEQYRVYAFDYADDPRVSYIHQDIPRMAADCVSILMELIQGASRCTCSIIPASLISSAK